MSKWERHSQLHQLKISPQWYDRLASGAKTSEVRRHDRDFQVGDTVEFMEWDDGWTGRDSIVRTITHVLPGHQVTGMHAEYCALSLAVTK